MYVTQTIHLHSQVRERDRDLGMRLQTVLSAVCLVFSIFHLSVCIGLLPH